MSEGGVFLCGNLTVYVVCMCVLCRPWLASSPAVIWPLSSMSLTSTPPLPLKRSVQLLLSGYNLSKVWCGLILDQTS